MSMSEVEKYVAQLLKEKADWPERAKEIDAEIARVDTKVDAVVDAVAADLTADVAHVSDL